MEGIRVEKLSTVMKLMKRNDDGEDDDEKERGG